VLRAVNPRFQATRGETVCPAPSRIAAIGVIAMTALSVSCRSIPGASGQERSQPQSVFAIPRMPAVVVDGDETDWGRDGFRVDILAPQPGTEPGQGSMPARTDFAAAMRLGWNETGLLVLLEVTGRDWSEGEKPDDLVARDSVEFYLAAYPGSPERLQWVVAPGMDPRFPEPRSQLHPFATARNLLKAAPAPNVARRRTESGYALEVLLPWAALRRSAAPGDEVAFQVMVNNHDRPGKPASHLLWYPTLGAAFDSRRLQRIRLAELADQPITARGLVAMDYREDKIQCDVFAAASVTGRSVRVRSSTGVLASGTLATDKSGFARARFAGKGTDDTTVYVDVDGQLADVVPLAMPRAELSIETRVALEPGKDGGVTAVLAAAAPLDHPLADGWVLAVGCGGVSRRRRIGTKQLTGPLEALTMGPVVAAHDLVNKLVRHLMQQHLADGEPGVAPDQSLAEHDGLAGVHPLAPDGRDDPYLEVRQPHVFLIDAREIPDRALPLPRQPGEDAALCRVAPKIRRHVWIRFVNSGTVPGRSAPAPCPRRTPSGVRL